MENQNLNDPSKEVQPNHESEHRQQTYQEETASEFVEREDSYVHERTDDELRNIFGWISIALSVLSFFWIPLLFAGTGIILGFVARNRGATVLGNIAIVIGIISILFRLLILPLI